MKLIPTSALALGVALFGVAPAHATDNAIKVPEATKSSNELIVEVTASEDGVVVIHGIKSGGDGRTLDPETVYGFVPVKKGVNTTVTVPLSEPLPEGRHLAVLYVDAGEVGQFEPGTDKPAKNSDGKPIMDRFKAN